MTKKRLVLVIVLGLVLILGLVLTLTLVNGEKWKSLVVDTISKNVTTELVIEDVEINLFSEFPKISVDLLNVNIAGLNVGNSKDPIPLLDAEKLSVSFSVWEVLLGDPVIENFAIEGGTIYVEELPNGKWNYEITPEASEDSPALEVSSIKLGNIDLELKSTVLNLSSIINRATYSGGNLSATFEDLQTENETVNSIYGSLESAIDLDTLGNISINASEAVVNGIALSAQVDFKAEEGLSFSGRCGSLSLDGIKSLVKDQSSFEGWSYEGKTSASFEGNGDTVDIKFSHPGGYFAVAPSVTGLALNLKGEFDAAGALSYYVKSGNVGVKIDQLHLTTNGLSAELTASSKNMSRDNLAVSGNATLDLGSSYKSWIPEINSSNHGHLPSAGSISYRGSLEVSPTGDISHKLLTLDIPNCSGSLAGSPYSLTNGSAKLSKYGTLIVENLDFDWAGNIGSASTELHKFTSILDGGHIVGELDLVCESIIVDPVITAVGLLSDSTAGSETAQLMPFGSSLKYDIRSKNLYWDELECTSFSSIGTVSHNRVRIAHARTTGINGEAVVDGSLRPGGPGWLLGLNGYADNISLPELFRVYGNFSQTILRSEHLSGEADVAGSLHLGWTLGGDWVSDAFDANLNVIIDAGKLSNLELFDEVADYLKENRIIAPLVDPEDLRSRLKKIDFENLESTFTVANSTTTLPFLNIHSSAMDVSIEGTQTFAGDIDYTLGFALRDLRDNKQGEFGNIEDDGLGNMFFLGMGGTLDKPVYYYDRQAHKAHRRRGLSEEAQRLRDAIQENKKEKSDDKKEKERVKEEKPSRKQRKEDSLLNSEDDDF